ncbi:MAG: cation:proton antiporter [Anaerolineales bacterium]|nr:cation:proton antiporter [Anaerolineales bacterium]
MPHETPLIATIAVSLAFAFIGGLIAVRFHLPPLVGYLLAGIAVGPFTPGFVADVHIAPQLAEIGVIFLMFGVGMHFSVRDLWEVRNIALPGSLVQIAVATILGMGVASLWGWSLGAGLVLGLALSVASTVVLLRALESHGLVNTNNGKIAIGWLIVEDLIMVLVLVILPPFAETLGGHAGEGHASPYGILATLGLTLGKVGLFVVFMLLGGTRFFPWLLKKVEKTGIRELFTLAVVAIGLGVAFGSAKLFGVSFALGAFFAGIVIKESDFSHRAVTDTQPLQDAFAVLFFVSVGMLFDPSILVKQFVQVLIVLAIIVLGKSLAAFTIVRILRFSSSTALIVSGALAQIGEFSFILAGLGVSLGLLSQEGQSLILAGALLSIILNPLIFNLAKGISAKHIPTT